MGSFKGLKQVRRIVEDCIQNKMHPVYHIKVKTTCIACYIYLLFFSWFLSTIDVFSCIPVCMEFSLEKSINIPSVDNLYLPLGVLMMCRFLWWRKNLKKILLLKMRTGTGSFLNIRSMYHQMIFSVPIYFLVTLAFYLLYFCCWITWIISGRPWNKRRLRVKRRNKTHHSLLLNNLAWWDHCFVFQYIFVCMVYLFSRKQIDFAE